jgi:hypothetical protein
MARTCIRRKTGAQPYFGSIFNAHRIVEGDLLLVRDPLQVLTGCESGIENVVAFLSENVTAQQVDQLTALMDE